MENVMTGYILEGALSPAFINGADILAMGTLNAIYWICLIVGGGLLLISTLFGGMDAADIDLDLDMDLDTDMDIDLDADISHDGILSLSSWFSMQFVVFFVAMFGVVGVVLSGSSGLEAHITLAIAISCGLLLGQGVHQTMRKIKSNSGDTTPQVKDYIKRLARVSIGIVQGAPGRSCSRLDQRIATSPHGASMKRTRS